MATPIPVKSSVGHKGQYEHRNKPHYAVRTLLCWVIWRPYTWRNLKLGDADRPSDADIAVYSKKLDDFNSANVQCYNLLLEKLCDLILSGKTFISNNLFSFKFFEDLLNRKLGLISCSIERSKVWFQNFGSYLNSAKINCYQICTSVWKSLLVMESS